MRYKPKPLLPFKSITNQKLAVNFIREYQPEWLVDMPLLISTCAPAKHPTVYREHYDHATERGFIVTYTDSPEYPLQHGWTVRYRTGSEERFRQEVEKFYASGRFR